MNGSRCERCGFTDWVMATQCKQCGAPLNSEGIEPRRDVVADSSVQKSFSKFGAALSSLYLLIVILIVSGSFTCGRVGDRWAAISYCLLLTLTVCSFPWPYVLGLLLSLSGISPSPEYDFLVFPYSILGITLNTLLLYKFGKAVSRGAGSSRA